MKRIKFIHLILTIAFSFILCVNANAQFRVSNSAKSSNNTSIVVTSTGTIYSKSFKTASSNKIGLIYKVTGTTPDVKISFQESYRPPKIEGSIDTSYIVTDVISTSATSDTYSLATIESVNLTYGRFLIQGNSGNGIATVDLIFAQ